MEDNICPKGLISWIDLTVYQSNSLAGYKRLERKHAVCDKLY